MDTFPAIRASRVCSCALWIISEYCTRSAEEIAAAVEMIKSCLGPLPLFREREEGEEAEAEAPTSLPIPIQMAAARPAVLADGSYATQTALPGSEAGGLGAGASAAAAAAAAAAPNLRALLLGGDFFLGAVIAATLTKLVLRLRALRALPPASLNRLAADVMALIAAMLRLAEAGPAAAAGTPPMDADSRDRMAGCLRALAAPGDEGLERVWLEDCRAAFATLITDKQQREAAEAKQEVRQWQRWGGIGVARTRGWLARGQVQELSSPAHPTSSSFFCCAPARCLPPTHPPTHCRAQKAKAVAQPDELIDFHHLKMRKGLSKVEVEDRCGGGGAPGGSGAAPASSAWEAAVATPCPHSSRPALQRCLRPGARHGPGGRRRRRLQPPEQDCAADRLLRPHLRRGLRHGCALLAGGAGRGWLG